MKDYITIYNQIYKSKAFKKFFDSSYCTYDRHTANNQDKNKKCYTCGIEFIENEPIHVCYRTSKARRRHLNCALRKNLVTKRRAQSFLFKVTKDMNETITPLMHSTMAYKLIEEYMQEKRDKERRRKEKESNNNNNKSDKK